MKNLLLGSLCLFLAGFSLNGCQTYPKNPAYPSTWGKRIVVNRYVPEELKPFELPPKIQYMDQQQQVPKQIIVVKDQVAYLSLNQNTTTSAEVVVQPVAPIVVTPIVTESLAPIVVTPISPVEGVKNVQ